MATRQITVGGLEYSNRSDWMGYFFTTSDPNAEPDNIIMCTQLFQNNIFNKCQQEYLEKHPQNTRYKDIMVENATEVDKMINYITTMRPNYTLPDRVQKPDASDRSAVERYLEYVNTLYNAVIDITTTPQKEETVVDIIRSNSATSANVHNVADSPYDAKIYKLIKRFTFNETTAEQLKQRYAELYELKIKTIHGHQVKFSIGDGGILIVKSTESKQLSQSINYMYISQHINTSIMFNVDTIRISDSGEYTETICEVINDDLVCSFHIDDTNIRKFSKTETAKYSTWLLKNVKPDGTINLNSIVKYYKDVFDIEVKVFSQVKTHNLTLINSVKYIKQDYLAKAEAYRALDTSAFIDLDWDEYDQKIYPLIMKSKFEHAFHAHIENNRVVITYIDEQTGGLDSIVSLPLNFINGHTHPFARYRGFDLELPSTPDFEYFMHECVEFKFLALALICTPEGVYAFKAKQDLLNNFIYPNVIDTCMDINKITEQITRVINTKVQYTRTTFKNCIDNLVREYDKMGVSLLFRPTPGFNLNKKTHRSATMFSLPPEIFEKQIDIISKVDSDYILNADFTEIDAFDRDKAGIVDSSAIVAGILYDNKKIIFAPYGMRELNITLTEPEKNFFDKYLSKINRMQSFAVVSIVIMYTDDYFPFIFDIKLIQFIASYILYGREKFCIILSESYIIIYDFVKNELRGPLDRSTKKYITRHGRNTKNS